MVQHYPERILKGNFIEQMADEEFFRFCQDNRDIKFERNAKGQIIVMSPTVFLTGDRNSEIITQLRIWNKKYKLGRVVDSDTGFFLPNGAMRNPDAAWVSNDQLKKLPAEELESFPHVCPAFVIELKSKSDRLVDLKAKMQEWMENGCQLGWLIDADAEVVYIYRPGASETQHANFDESLSGEPQLPHFSFVLKELRL